MTVRLRVFCGANPFQDGPYGCGRLLYESSGERFVSVDEKYPFWCDHCETDGRGEKYPWQIVVEVLS